MSDPISPLLFYPFEKNMLADLSGATLLWNAQYCGTSNNLENFDCVNNFKPSADTWYKSVEPTLDRSKKYQNILCEIPKQKEAAFYMLALGLNQMEENGLLLAVASNDAGGKRLEKWFTDFGLSPQSTSKQKCRIVWARKGNINQSVVEEYLALGQPKKLTLGDQVYTTQAGVFGWDKIDIGSALLLDYLPEILSGVGADFGCGYGYLSHQILARQHKIKKLYAFDADYNALECAKENLKNYEKDIEISYGWEDLTKIPVLSEKLDWVVMNPPFHDGKNTSSVLGEKFIETAAATLKKEGVLYMVANAHLPYERALQNHFSSITKVAEEKGFKIFIAIK